MTDDVLGAAALRRAYREGERRPAEVVETVLERLRERAGDHAWISTVAPAALRTRAAELDARWAERHDLPLYGLPFAVKDNIDVIGLSTTAACPDFAYQPTRTAPVVRRLLDAGALLVGKTNLDQFATGLTGSRSPYGACESVFGGGLISGGSSSGSAVAVAAGTVSFALGTDTAGSGRVPAALNGIVGIKPTRGLLSNLGVVPACRSLDCVSIFAGDAAGAGLVFDVARGFEPDDPWSRAAGAEAGRTSESLRFGASDVDRARESRWAGSEAARVPGSLTVGVPDAADLEFFGDADQRERFDAACGRVAGLVAACLPFDPAPLFEAGDLLYQGPWVAERLADLGDFLNSHPDSVLPVTRGVLESGWRASAVEAFRARHRLQELRACTRRLFAEVDVLVVPTIGTTYSLDEIAADPVGRNLRLGRYTQFANLLDLAAVTIPNGMTAGGRPASLTLLGPAFSDATLGLLAAVLQQPEAAVLQQPERLQQLECRPSEQERPGRQRVVLRQAEPAPGGTVTIAVVGLHLRGEPRNAELTDRSAVLIGPARTAACYRLYRLPSPSGGLPGLVRIAAANTKPDPSDEGQHENRPGSAGPGNAGAGIEVELWELPLAAVGGLLAGVPAPLSLGRVRLSDGREVLGFLCEAYAAGVDAEDITAGGGWRAYRAGTLPDRAAARVATSL